MAWIPILTRIFGMGAAGGGGTAAAGGFGGLASKFAVPGMAGSVGGAPTAGSMVAPAAGGGGGFGGVLGNFGAPGTPGSVNGAPMPMTPRAGAAGQRPNFNPMAGGSGGGSDAQAEMDAAQTQELDNKKWNIRFNALKQFGHSLGGLDKTPLNNIPRNSPQVIMPADIQNPGTMALAALMAKIAGGQ